MQIVRPDHFDCPITHELMRFPQKVESCGHVFERDRIRASFLDRPNRCPQCHDKQVAMNLVSARDRYREIKNYVLHLFRTQSAEVSDPEVEQFLIAHPKLLEAKEVADYFCTEERSWTWLRLEKTVEREDTALIEQVRELMGREPQQIFNNRLRQTELDLLYCNREQFECALKRKYQREGVEQYRAVAKAEKLRLEDLFFRMKQYQPPPPPPPAAPAAPAAPEPGFQLIRPILIDNVRRMANDWWTMVVPIAIGPMGLAGSLGISLAVLIGNVVATCVAAGGIEVMVFTAYLLAAGQLFLLLYWCCFMGAIIFFFGQMIFAGMLAGMGQPAFLGAG
jgi:hypothetical protein